MALIVTPALLAGCASIPRSPTPLADIADLDCDGLAREQAASERTREAALRARSGAWKAMLPVAVAVRYASAQSALSDAEQRLQQVRGRRDARQCADADSAVVDLGAEV
ncbi:hypothetical protein LVB77_01640 [Lysobacter sp. 5GHs7-4]|uniref:hypothetical protein n=1 Tax=Lysobacter sp. 5GHs7-4 TaxID=2904253 RepID=UPI001E47F77C|nr:hypothetical protein [Lysobacter sp. 5GHs7-4]UHQ23442.1 hypothetical protein LVB77_01640 [Lysobacter sp. 5GHs7-4]